MRAKIKRFEGPYAICIKEDNSIIDIKRINIPRHAIEGDILNIDTSPITIQNQRDKENTTMQ